VVKTFITKHIGIESVLESRERDLGKGGDTLDSSVVNQHIYPTVLLQNTGQHVLYARVGENMGSCSRSAIEPRDLLVATTRQLLAANARARAWPMPPAEHPVISTTCLS
jgi:hypothetical protein